MSCKRVVLRVSSPRMRTLLRACLMSALCLACACAPAGADAGSGDESAPPQVLEVPSDPGADEATPPPLLPAPVTGPRARVLVTTDYGMQAVLDEVVGLHNGTTAMQALKSVAEVGTAYGGGFVQSIDGIGSARESRTDWFYAVNGILANRGSADHVMRDGDFEHWDYRGWSFRRNVTATLGSYPYFFLNGYTGKARPTVVVHEARFESEAAILVSLLVAHGVDDVESIALPSLPDEWKKHRNLIIIAGPDEEMVRDIYAVWDRLGLFANLELGTLRVFTAAGDEAVAFGEGAGVVEAMQNPWNPSGIGACENVVLLLSGTDEAGVRAAVAAVVDSGDTMMAWCGAVVHDGVVMPSPMA